MQDALVKPRPRVLNTFKSLCRSCRGNIQMMGTILSCLIGRGRAPKSIVILSKHLKTNLEIGEWQSKMVHIFVQGLKIDLTILFCRLNYAIARSSLYIDTIIHAWQDKSMIKLNHSFYTEYFFQPINDWNVFSELLNYRLYITIKI